ncbi:hypothetical protein B0H63DRAFT_125697 [Podospora didyma]|uniref:Uncharacterized protein n=1 Tax=Podospora didyma TaxID=330526 RepID=A0AAE0U4Q9_9PEZI|nr:hypothetical protein B0H63DRAFT_125697 [Podospora didyma]
MGACVPVVSVLSRIGAAKAYPGGCELCQRCTDDAFQHCWAWKPCVVVHVVHRTIEGVSQSRQGSAAMAPRWSSGQMAGGRWRKGSQPQHHTTPHHSTTIHV